MKENNRVVRTKFDLGPRRLIAYLSLGFAYPSMMGVVYMQYVYYDAMVGTLGCTNAQLGLLLTIDGIGAMLFALPGGILADRFNANKVLFASLIAAAVGAAVFAMFPTYAVALAVWSLFSVAMCGFYPSVFKLVRLIAPANAGGRSFGFFGMCNAVGYIAINGLALFIYDNASKQAGLIAGFASVVWVFAICLAVFSVLEFFAVRGIEMPYEEPTGVDAVRLKDIAAVLKMPGTWLVFVIGFVVTAMHITASYFTPYFTAVFGITVVFSGAFAVLRQYGLRIVSSPVGGWLGDRIGSNSKIIAGGLVIASLILCFVMKLPAGVSAAIAAAGVLSFAFVDNMLISLCYSTLDEALIPPKYTGAVLGVATIVLPDLFIPTMFGSWLDAYGNAGFDFIFMFTVLLNLVGVVAALAVVWRKRQAKSSTR